MPAEIASPLHLAPVEDKALRVDCEGGRWSAAGGLVRLHDPADPLGLTRDWAAGLRDPRAPRRVNLTRPDRLTPRLWHLAAGEDDAHAATTRRHDPLCQWRLGRLPDSGPPWASPFGGRFSYNYL
jgi:Transposase DDE domain group 1